jgi:hypothetical protein
VEIAGELLAVVLASERELELSSVLSRWSFSL